MYAKFIAADGRFAFSDEDNGGIQIDQAAYDALFAAQAVGKQIVPDANGAPVAVDPATLTLAAAQAAQIDALTASYQKVIFTNVAYMGTAFQADDYSQTLVTKCLSPGAVPAGFFWNDANNAQVPMTFAQLQGLAAAMLQQGQAAFAKLQNYKAQVRAAAAVAAVQAVVWQ